MLPLERQEAIITILETKKSATVEELCSMLNSSSATIRRDLVVLEKSKRLRRTHGGACLSPASTQPRPKQSASESKIENSKIAKQALRYIKDGSTIFLDSSLSCYELSKLIDGFSGLRLVTNSLSVLDELSSKDSAELYCLGGRLDSKVSAFCGTEVIEAISTYHADIAFISCDGIDTQAGITDFDKEQAAIKKALIKNADKAILLCRSDSFYKKSFCKICDLNDVDEIISDALLPIDLLEKKEGIEPLDDFSDLLF